jgi:tetratricopeptide (TPR) repeat protein
MADFLSPGAKRWYPLAAALVLGSVVSYGAALYARAEAWVNAPNPFGLEKAAQLQPDNAEYWDRLGRFRQFDFENSDLPRAIEHYKRATKEDPLEADYWLDLATAYEGAGEDPLAREAFLRAKQTYPLSSEVAWRYGNFLLRQGQLEDALVEIHRAVSGDPKLVPLAASRALHATGDIERVLRDVLPPTQETYLAALDAFVEEDAVDPAFAVWRRLARLGETLELRRVNRLVDKLAGAQRVDDARAVWQQALLLSHSVPAETRDFPLITDGGFERDPTNGGFDWRIFPLAGIGYAFDTTMAHSGSRSLRITFDGSSNVDFTQVQQSVVVEPGTRYRLSAYFRLESLTTDSGIRLTVYNPGGPGTISPLSSSLVGSLPWGLSEVEFTTGPVSRVVEIHLCRLPSGHFDNKIRGTVWVDDVFLVPVKASAPVVKP